MHRIIETKNEKFPIGSTVFAQVGWRTHTIINPAEKLPFEVYKLPDFGNLPLSLALGVLGMPGNTAYFGFLEICKPKAGEVVAVSAAGGAVGSLVGQIAKLKGCKVIGFAGSDDKCTWLEKELGFDKVINYKRDDLEQLIKEAAPDGIDCYFDNVSGMLSYHVIEQMRDFGRISWCGAIATYNGDKIMVPAFGTFHRRQLKMEGFQVYRFADRWMEGIQAMLKWVQEGKIKHHETVTDGFENMPKAFIEMLRGDSTGKAIVKV